MYWEKYKVRINCGCMMLKKLSGYIVIYKIQVNII